MRSTGTHGLGFREGLCPSDSRADIGVVRHGNLCSPFPAEDASQTIEQLSGLHDRNMEKIQKLGRASAAALKVFHYLEQNPIIDIGKTAQELGISFSTTSGAIRRLEEHGIGKSNPHILRPCTSKAEK